MQLISAIASIATLILFIFYFIGRIWTLSKEQQFATERFRVTPTKESVEHNDDFDFGGAATIEVVSLMAYKYFAVTPVEYDIDTNNVKKVGVPITKYNIQANRPLYIVIDIPEIIPQYIVEFQRYDGIKGSFYILESGRTGEIVAWGYNLKHTASSISYYLFR